MSCHSAILHPQNDPKELWRPMANCPWKMDGHEKYHSKMKNDEKRYGVVLTVMPFFIVIAPRKHKASPVNLKT